MYLVVLQRVLHGERLDELLRADETQSVLKAENRKRCEEEREDEDTEDIHKLSSVTR